MESVVANTDSEDESREFRGNDTPTLGIAQLSSDKE
jgi:hypothetical protein